MKIATRINLGENAQMALTTLRENKMRSFLTVLGVVIGITALLSVVSILMGVYADVNAYTGPTRCSSFASIPASTPGG